MIDTGNCFAVETFKLSKHYARAEALVDLDLQVEPGIILGVLGPNGSGKSTMLNLIAGFSQPNRGKVRVFGERPGVNSRRKMAYLPEHDHLYSWMKVKEQLEFLAPFFPDWQKQRSQELLDFMQLDEKQLVGNLSRGMRARLKLLICMARSAPLVLLDEPFSGIDPVSRSIILETIISRFKSGEQTVILSTHEIYDAEQLFDQVLFLVQGRKALCGDVEGMRHNYNKSMLDIFKEVSQR